MAHLRSGTFERAISGPGADAEVAPAVRAPVGHRLSLGNLAGIDAPALPAAAPASPHDAFKPRGSGFLGREHVHQIDDGHAFAVRSPRCLWRSNHRKILQKPRQSVK